MLYVTDQLGPRNCASTTPTPLCAFGKFFTEEIFQIILTYTNEKLKKTIDKLQEDIVNQFPLFTCA